MRRRVKHGAKHGASNYVTARWCFHEGLNVDFFWLGVHCLEKYLKAALLLNGRRTIGYGHNIVKLYAAVEPLAPELLPDTLTMPRDMPLQYWYREGAKDYIERLYRNGQAHNRYQLYGYDKQAEDLWKLDQLVFSVRRLWPAPGSEDTELGVLMEPEVGHGETEVYPRVQA